MQILRVLCLSISGIFIFKMYIQMLCIPTTCMVFWEYETGFNSFFRHVNPYIAEDGMPYVSDVGSMG